jgi:hypothetical protein
MLDIEFSIVELFHWSLHDIDETDIESLIPFVMGYPAWKARQKAGGGSREVFVDDVDW